MGLFQSLFSNAWIDVKMEQIKHFYVHFDDVIKMKIFAFSILKKTLRVIMRVFRTSL